MRRYSLFKRQNSPFFYVQLRNPQTGKYLPPKSTGKTEESEALLVVADWLKNGIPDREGRKETRDLYTVDTILSGIRGVDLSEKDAFRIIEALKAKGVIETAVIAGDGPDNDLLFPFLRRFWDYDTSPYVQDKIQHGHSISRQHCYSQLARMPYWEKYFPTERIKDVTRQKLKNFGAYMYEKDLASDTINKILNIGLIAFKWAHQENILNEDPGVGLKKYSGPGQGGIRNIIKNFYELAELFALESRSFTANSFDMGSALDAISDLLNRGSAFSVLSDKTAKHLNEARSKTMTLFSQSKNSNPGLFISILHPS